MTRQQVKEAQQLDQDYIDFCVALLDGREEKGLETERSEEEERFLFDIFRRERYGVGIKR